MVPHIDSEFKESERKMLASHGRGNDVSWRNSADLQVLERHRESLLEQRQRLQARPGAKVTKRIVSHRERQSMSSRLSIFSAILGQAVTERLMLIRR